MRQRLGRWCHWIIATRARRSALTLAVLTAMAAPFVPIDEIDGTPVYEQTFQLPRYTELTSMERAQIKAQWGEDEDISGCYERGLFHPDR